MSNTLTADSIRQTEVATPKAEPNWEAIFGCSIAFLAAVLAVADLGAGKYGDDALHLSNEKTSQYLWYQSKGIKENLEEGRLQMLQALSNSGSITASSKPALDKLETEIIENVARYKKEKKEILLGSKAVGKENWVQDIGGELGKVVGAKELEDKLDVLGKAGDKFDLANLCLQISLVIGAVGIITKKNDLKRLFLATMYALGIGGGVFCYLAYRIAFSSN